MAPLKKTRIRSVVCFFALGLFLFCGRAEAVGEYASIIRGTVVQVISLGDVEDYILKRLDGSSVLLKWPDLKLHDGDEVAFFARKGAKENGMETYLPLKVFAGRGKGDERPMLFSEGFASIQLADSFGPYLFFDKKGNSLGKPFDKAGVFKEGLASVAFREKDWQWGFIDKTGQIIIEPNFSSYRPMLNEAPFFRNGFAFVNDEKGKVFIDKTGKTTRTKGILFALTEFSEGLAIVLGESNNELYLMDENGKLTSKKPFATNHNVFFKTPAFPFSEELAAVSNGSSFGYIDHSGKFVIQPEYELALPFSEGVAPVQTKEGKWGFIDAQGDLIINPVYDLAFPFSDGLAPVKLGKSWGYVNREGSLVIKAQFEQAGFFSDGVAPVAASGENGFNSRWGLIDKKGDFIVKPQYEVPHKETLYGLGGPISFSDGLLLIRKDFMSDGTRVGDRWSWMDRSGKEVLFFISKRESLW